ncbi:hypothetical protein NECID01_0966 [Nematocida sp. AWRm77]|nr:hypothetical protein NECID01_0966 [Nematocida sp. AWRm77]
MDTKDSTEEKKARTFESLDGKEKKEYRRIFMEEHSGIIFPFLEKQGDGLQLESLEGWREDVPKTGGLLWRVSSGIKSLFFSIKKHTYRDIATSFTFGSQPLYIPYEVEAAMQIIDQDEMYTYKELFRESSSVEKMSMLQGRLQELKKKYYPYIEMVNKEKEMASVQEFITALKEEMRATDVLTLSGTFKNMIRSIIPIFPSKYLNVYIEIEKCPDVETKIILSQFVIAFLMTSEKRRDVEVMTCFFYSLITHKESLLKFKNISIVFTPMFFIDESHQICPETYKDTLECLQRFLQFFLENALSIFLI